MGVVKVHNPALGCDVLRAEADADDGLPIYVDALDGLALKLRRRIAQGHQNVVLFVGRTNSGKSTAAIQLCMMLDKFFTLEADYVYDTPDMASKIARAEYEPVCPVTLCDEGSLIFNKQDYATKGGKDAIKLLDTIRLLHWTIVVCAPSMDEINSKLVAVHVDYLVDCGAGSPVPGYSRKGFFKVFEKRKYLFSKVWWSPICWGVFRPLTPRQYAEYEKFKAKASASFRRSYVKRNKGDDDDDGDNSRREQSRVQQDPEERL